MVKVSANGQMALATVETGLWVKWKDQVVSHFLIKLFTQDNFTIIKNMEKEISNSQMEAKLMVYGSRIKFKEMQLLLIQKGNKLKLNGIEMS